MTKSAAVLMAVFFLSFAVVHCARAEKVLTWKECVAEAHANHPDLISAAEDITQAQAAHGAASSDLLPHLDASASVSTQKTAGRSKSAKIYSYGVGASQLIFDAFKSVDETRQAAESTKAAKEAYRFTSAAIRLRLRSAFINVFRAQELAYLSRDIFDIRRKNLELIMLRYQSGLEHRGALLTAEANLAQAQLEISRAQRDLTVSQRQLSREMGSARFEPMQVEGIFEVSAEEQPDFDALALKHPTLTQAQFQKNAARYGLSAARADFFPELTGQLGASRTGSRLPARGEEWSAGLTVAWPFFEGGLKTAQLERAMSQLRQTEADERSARDGVVTALAETFAALADAIETVGVTQKFLAAAAERSRIAEAQYSLGLISFDNWTIIQDDLVNSKKNVLSTQVSALLSEALWREAKGETLEYAE